MFFELFESEWGELLYIPTEAGEALLTILIGTCLLLAMVFTQMSGRNATVRKLLTCAACIGAGAALASVRPITLANGGMVTLFSLLVVCLPGYFFGLGAGILSGAAFGILQIIIDPYLLTFPQIMVDYILAFAALGLSGIFAEKKWGLLKGYILGVLGRYVFAVISGWIFFGEYAWEGWDPLSYSLAYNGSYIFIEMAITVVIILLPFVRKYLEKLKVYVNLEAESNFN